MPICFRPESPPGKQELPGKDQAAPSSPEWPEPPGYLGEAVRRAKRISAQAQGQPPGNLHKD
jgi:hypothetical protein